MVPNEISISLPHPPLPCTFLCAPNVNKWYQRQPSQKWTALTPQLPLPAIFNNQEVLTLISAINPPPFLHPQCCSLNVGCHHYMSALLQQPLPSIISSLCSTCDIFKNTKPFMMCLFLNPSIFSPILPEKRSKVFNMVCKTRKV